jgi:hypothetical protein
MIGVAYITGNRSNPARNHVEVTSRVPESGRPGEPLTCRWEIENRGADTVAATFYLSGEGALVADLACPGGRVLRGRFHATASLVLAPRATVTVSAKLEPLGLGTRTIRATLLTSQETIGCVDSVVVD